MGPIILSEVIIGLLKKSHSQASRAIGAKARRDQSSINAPIAIRAIAKPVSHGR